MLTFEQAQELLTQYADDIPPEIYRSLNGGMILLPETKLHPGAQRGEIYILGQYHYDPRGFGRYITIYYGSFCCAHGHLSHGRQAEKLREVLYHELTHHLEHLAGDKSLEVKDAVQFDRYRREGKWPKLE